jgi:hypothetical protein
LEFGAYTDCRISAPIEASKSAVSVVELDELEVEFVEFDVEFNSSATSEFEVFKSFRSDVSNDVEPMTSPQAKTAQQVEGRKSKVESGPSGNEGAS